MQNSIPAGKDLADGDHRPLGPHCGAAPTALVAIASENDRERVSDSLGEDGFDVAVVADGFHLVQHLAGAVLNVPGSMRPTLIIADAALPGCTGISLLTGLRSLGWQTPVILLTSAGNDEARWQAWNHSVTGLFIEPYDPHEVREFARIVLDPDAGEAIVAARSSATGRRHRSSHS